MTTIKLRNAFIVALISMMILFSQGWVPSPPSLVVRDHSTRSKEDYLDLLGVSVHHLDNNFMNLVRQRKKWWQRFRRAKHYTIYEIEDLSKLDKNGIIREKGKDVICPIDGKKGAAYVHTLQGADHVGPASIMLSYTWGYRIGDIVDVLTNYCESNNLNPKEVYVWICCLCNNQHRVVEMKKRGEVVPFEEFHQIFHRRVTGIGHIVAMMSPWTGPAYLNRVWCIFELFTADKEDCKVTIEMPERERKEFLKGLEKDASKLTEKLFGVLSSTDVETAEASVTSDRENILNIVKNETTSGFDKFNITINQLIRTWVMQLIQKKARSRLEDVVDGEYDEDCSSFHQCVGCLFHRLGENENAMEMFQVALEMVEKKFGSDHLDMVYLLNNIATVLYEQGKYKEALDNYKKALIIVQKEYGRDTVEVAARLNNMGEAYRKLGNNDKAMDTLNRALVINEEKMGPDHIDTSKTHMSIAIVLDNQGKYEDAMEKYNQVLPIYEKEYGSNSVDMGGLLGNMAATLTMQGKYEDALEKLQLSLAIKEKLLGMDHQASVNTRDAIAILQEKI